MQIISKTVMSFSHNLRERHLTKSIHRNEPCKVKSISVLRLIFALSQVKDK